MSHADVYYYEDGADDGSAPIRPTRTAADYAPPSIRRGKYEVAE
jgi:hypothetical protein